MSLPDEQNPDGYNIANIISRDPRQHVRIRPGMYIGGIDKRALHNMLRETVDDAISEFEDTSYNEITISLFPQRTVQITDNGLGLPVDNAENGQSKLEQYMTYMGMFYRNQFLHSKSHRVAGLHGTGLLAINALSSFFQVKVKRDGFLWRQSYSEGLPTSPLEQIRPLEADESTGTSIIFSPDFTVMDENDFDFEYIAKHCQQLVYLLPQLCFIVQDKRDIEKAVSFHYPQSLLDWLKTENAKETPIIEPLTVSHSCTLHDRQDKSYIVKIQIALQWLDSGKELIRSFVNTIETPEGGTHIMSLITALRRALEMSSWQTLKNGFVCIIHILHPDPQFESQARVRLLNTDVYTAIDEAIEALFAAHPEAKAAIQAHFSGR